MNRRSSLWTTVRDTSQRRLAGAIPAQQLMALIIQERGIGKSQWFTVMSGQKELGKGKRPPTTPELAKLLCGKFLSPDYENHPLTQVADYAISESSLFEVQDFIRELITQPRFERFERGIQRCNGRASLQTKSAQLPSISSAWSSSPIPFC